MRAVWRAAWQAAPGPAVSAAWIVITVPLPLIFFAATHRWEENQPASTALWWPVAALPMLAALVAARWTRRVEPRRSASAFLTAMAAGVLFSAPLFGLSLAGYRWVIPLGGQIDWPPVVWLGLSLAAAGAAVGHLAGPPARRGARRPRRAGRLTGALVVVAGVLLAPVTVRLGAEDSTTPFDQRSYGEAGPAASAIGGEVRLPAGDRYAVMAVGFAPDDPDCDVTGPGMTRTRADLVTIPPSDYGSDAATYSWVASFSVPAAGTYSLTCRTHDEGASYVVADVPPIRGAVGSMIHWPLPVIWLLGSVPGLLVLADTVRRRGRHDRSSPR